MNQDNELTQFLEELSTPSNPEINTLSSRSNEITNIHITPDDNRSLSEFEIELTDQLKHIDNHQAMVAPEHQIIELMRINLQLIKTVKGMGDIIKQQDEKLKYLYQTIN